MDHNLTQEQRLDLLLDAFLRDSQVEREIPVPQDPAEKRGLLRALMNVRPPRPLDEDTLQLQDSFLKTLAEEKGIVFPEEIPSLAASGFSSVPWADCLSLWQGDITRLAVDAIVNAANSQMLGCFVPLHNCIDNCIHSYAGIQLRLDCARQMNALRIRCGSRYEQPTATPMLTEGYNLPAKKVIHIVGPVVESTLTKEQEQELSDCYRNTLDLCLEKELRTVAFCGISTGVFRFPKERAAEIAVQTVTDWLSAHPDKLERVVFAVLSDRSREIYEDVLARA